MNLFQVPQPSMGLMGRLPSSRIQGRNRMPGMAGLELEGLLPPPADAIDEAMIARAAEQEALVRAQQEVRPRERVSGWRILDRVLGGQTISEGLDTERARLQAEADRPRAQAIAMENERIARAMGPQALLALRLNGEKLGEQVAEGFGTDVVAAGSGLFSGGRRVGEQARTVESGDEILSVGSGGVTPLYTRRNPSIAESTVMDRNAIDRDKLALDRQTAGYELSQGQTRFGLNNQPLASVAPSANAERRRSYEDSAGVRRFEDDGSPVFPDDAARVSSQARGRLDAASTSATNLLSEIDKALKLTGGGETGIVGSIMGGVPGTRAQALRATIETIKANIGFNYLQQMRELSPTGGALGSVAVQEMTALQSVLANLDPNLSEAQLEANLNQAKAIIAQGQALRERTFNEQFGASRAGSNSGGSVSREAALAEARRRGLIP